MDTNNFLFGLVVEFKGDKGIYFLLPHVLVLSPCARGWSLVLSAHKHHFLWIPHVWACKGGNFLTCEHVSHSSSGSAYLVCLRSHHPHFFKKIHSQIFACIKRKKISDLNNRRRHIILTNKSTLLLTGFMTWRVSTPLGSELGFCSPSVIVIRER